MRSLLVAAAAVAGSGVGASFIGSGVCLHRTARFSALLIHRDVTRQGTLCLLERDGLLQEARRRLSRAQKKLDKAEQRASECEEQQAKLLASSDASLDELEALPPCDTLRQDVEEKATYLKDVNELVRGLEKTPTESSAQFAELTVLATKLGIDDKPPLRPPPPPKKPKGPRPKPRLPYRVFTSEDGAEIRVGKTAADNDLLSLEPEHRDGNDWWMHAAGCPGSHVVIRADTLSQPNVLPSETKIDAAVLAANYSRAVLNGKVGVTLCRARQVKKPPGAKAGLVQLQGNVEVIHVNWKREKQRLERLQQQINRSS
eukprot:2774163-Pleurochrysis_carterae.AAC.2